MTPVQSHVTNPRFHHDSSMHVMQVVYGCKYDNQVTCSTACCAVVETCSITLSTGSAHLYYFYTHMTIRVYTCMCKAHRLPQQQVLSCMPSSWHNVNHFQLMTPLKNLHNGSFRHLTCATTVDRLHDTSHTLAQWLFQTPDMRNNSRHAA